jgi:hypothetical protein
MIEGAVAPCRSSKERSFNLVNDDRSIPLHFSNEKSLMQEVMTHEK